jgi:response regulator RpfG family c-di-GMP phosphodiesterase
MQTPTFDPTLAPPGVTASHFLRQVRMPEAGRAFLNDLVRRRLLDAPSVGGFLQQSGHRVADLNDPARIGPALVAAGLLTDYQLARVLAGTAHGLVLGNYRVLERLGGGSVGIVFQGEHILLRRQVAIKVLPVDDDFPACILERFHAEMRLLAGLNHPHIVTAHDAGSLVPAEPRHPTLHYLVMELVAGGDLEQYVYDHGPADIPQACEWARQAASGLQEAHDHHLIHRDLKPSNLLLTEQGQVKLVDFGLARQFYSNLTDPRALLGSVEFMAPEQSVDPTAVSNAADIFALGATLFWLLTGQTPFPADDNLAKLLRTLQNDRPRRLREFRPDAPEELERLIDRMLERDPQRRPAMPITVMNELVRYTAPAVPAWEVDLGCDPGRVGASPEALTPPGSAVRVLVVDDDRHVRTLVRHVLEPAGCSVTEAADGAAALRALESGPCDLLVLDLRMPGLDGYAVCRQLRERPPCPHLKVVVFSGHSGPEELTAALAHGADEFLPKPFDPQLLAAKVQHLLRLKDAQDRADRLSRHLLIANRQLEQSLQARSDDVRQAQDALLFALAKMAESRPGETAGHQRRLQRYAGLLADRLRGEPDWAPVIDRTFLDHLVRCTPLHDLGMLVLPEAVLLKPGALTPEERRLVDAHTLTGCDLLDAIGREFGDAFAFLSTARAIVRHHHERFDGTGYPDGLIGDAIPPAARIVALADVYDALRRQRPHKPALTHRQAVRWLLEESAGQFDPALLRAFALCHDEFNRVFSSLGL